MTWKCQIFQRKMAVSPPFLQFSLFWDTFNSENLKENRCTWYDVMPKFFHESSILDSLPGLPTWILEWFFGDFFFYNIFCNISSYSIFFFSFAFMNVVILVWHRLNLHEKLKQTKIKHKASLQLFQYLYSPFSKK